MLEPPSCYRHDQRKARKEHKCCECEGVIWKGEVYHFHHGVWDGVAASYKVCSDCEALKAEVDRDVKHDDERTPFGELAEAVREPRLGQYMAIRWKRGAPVAPWLAEVVNKEKSNG
jgi:hypothetical protein